MGGRSGGRGVGALLVDDLSPRRRRDGRRPGGAPPHHGGPLRGHVNRAGRRHRSEEHTSELHSLMRSSYAGLCLKTKTLTQNTAAKVLLQYQSTTIKQIRYTQIETYNT